MAAKHMVRLCRDSTGDHLFVAAAADNDDLHGDEHKALVSRTLRLYVRCRANGHEPTHNVVVGGVGADSTSTASSRSCSTASSSAPSPRRAANSTTGVSVASSAELVAHCMQLQRYVPVVVRDHHFVGVPQQRPPRVASMLPQRNGTFDWSHVKRKRSQNPQPQQTIAQPVQSFICFCRSEEPIASSTNMDISTGHMILAYLEEHLHNSAKLDEEWTTLALHQPDADKEDTSVGRSAENHNKNRRPDVVPYEHTRVQLKAVLDNDSTGYINASALHDADPRAPMYIATQAPLAGTTADFWQMIWEQGSVIIVNLTRLSELSHRYWPEGGSQTHGIFDVHLVSEHIWCEDYLVRSFYLKNLRTNETRTVTQFHFLTWSEGGVPPATKPLLEFRRKVNKSYRGRSSPVVVHCSDGTGRAGTYCLLDMVLTRIAKGVKEIDIAATLEHVLDQRVGLVGSKSQYEFVLTCVADEVQAILRALAQAPPAP